MFEKLKTVVVEILSGKYASFMDWTLKSSLVKYPFEKLRNFGLVHYKQLCFRFYEFVKGIWHISSTNQWAYKTSELHSLQFWYYRKKFSYGSFGRILPRNNFATSSTKSLLHFELLNYGQGIKFGFFCTNLCMNDK